ncbi:MAG: CehA/McbA family metallohydrolase [Deltaproteobacteria bacterium]|nr:CehA/McbA family metallohydrolase [Deltaproteobacteria bacterium]
MRILADGSDGPAIVRVEAEAVPFLKMLGALWAVVRQPDMYMMTDYIAEPGKPWITIESTVYFGWDGEGEPPESEPATYPENNMPVIEWAVENGVALGDFYMSGGSVDIFCPGMGFDEDTAIFEAQERGENLFLEPFRFEWVAGVAEGVSYGIAPEEGAAYIPLFTASQTAVMVAGQEGNGSPSRFPAGTALSFRRYFFVGHGDVGSIVDGWLEATDQLWGFVSGHVLEESTNFPMPGADVLVFEPGEEAPWSQWRADVDPRDDREDGSFGGRLPVGAWELLVHMEGRPDSARLPITVGLGEEVAVTLVAPRPGLLSFTVRDERGRMVPSKVSIFPVDGQPSRNPVYGDTFIAGSPEAVVWPLHGTGEVELPDGDYYAVASRGLEYELDISEPFEISPLHRHHVDFLVTRSLDTEGWVSGDLHVHAAPSHDSGMPLVDRVRSMACEGVEFFVGTDHDYLTDYAPLIEDLGVGDWVSTAVGNESTTVELGHFLGFPLAQKFTGDAGGAFDWTDLPPEDIFDEFRAAGEEAGFDPVVFVGHPRAGLLGYFDQYGLDPYGGTPGLPGSPGTPSVHIPTLGLANPLISSDLFSTDFDGMELMGTKDLYYVRTPTQPELDRFVEDGSTTIYDIFERTLQEQQDLKDGVYRFGWGHEGQIEDWFTLLNLGFRHTALSNSDTHGWTSTEAGCPRNYIASSTDDPAFIDEQEMADAVKAHRVVATYGPFVRIWVDGHPIGDEVVPADATVDLQVEVQAPTWMDIDRVEIYQNGTLIHVFEVDIEGDPYRLEETLEITLSEDAWFVAIAMGDEDLAPLFTPVEVPYIPLDDVVMEALGAVEAVTAFLTPSVPIPHVYPIYPFGLTNPIWVDLDGNGFDAPGIPDWLVAPEEPSE